MLKLSFHNQVLAGFAVSILLVFIVGILSFNSINQLEDDTVMVDHTQKVIKTSTDLLQQLVNAETSMRGYGATDKKSFLEPYNFALPLINTDVTELKSLIADNPVQVKRVEQLSPLVNSQFDILKTNIETRDTQGLEYMVQHNMFVNGKQNMDAIRKLITSIIDTENNLLAIRKASSKQASGNVLLFILVGSLIFLVIIVVLFYYIQQTFTEQKKIEEEIRVTNEELMCKTEMLQASEEELKTQQEELRNTNAELEEKASLLEEKNQAIEEARQAINIKVHQLETTGKFKSEFLANMSHELRTPLNSILVLARILKDNKPANLSEDQVKYASVIYNAGNDLLTLINDILDLSKIESGKLDMQNEHINITEILGDMESLFAEVAANKSISYTTNIAENVQPSLFTDKVRVEQVIKNLLSNAFKFTPDGGSITINVVKGKGATIDFCIKDTGIGIPADKQKVIFEAFQQADGSTSRKYGGTGLGLSISRELAALLGGHISLTSTPGHGSEFILTVPLIAKQVTEKGNVILPTAETFETPSEFLKTTKKSLHPDRDPLVVIVEDDKNFSDILQDYARDHGYKSIIVNEGNNAVNVVKENQPDAVIMDIMLPGKDGWQILKELKQLPETTNIPVHLMSAGDAADNKVRKEGAISFLKKPMDVTTLDKLFGDIMVQSGAKFRQILLVEDHQAQSQALKEMMQSNGIAVDQAFDGKMALRMLAEKEYQCIILDLNLPDISGLDILDKIKEDERFESLPVIVNTAMDLDKTSVSRLMKYANAMVVKTNKSSDRLIDEVNLFLNKVSETTHNIKVSTNKNSMMTASNNSIKGKKVLIVDDDMRNIFALSSALQSYDMNVEVAGDGEEALAKLEDDSDVDIVLMDIMMPKMDGYEAMRQIRKQNKWTRLPVIALTAKAMMDDREKCIEAGANDYITKPVDIDRLIALMQLWLEK